MDRAGNLFFNVVTTIFIVLTLLLGVVILGVAGGAMEPPILALDEDDPLPTEVVLNSPTPRPSWTPSHTPTPTPTYTATITPTVTATGTATATATYTLTLTPTITNTPLPTETSTVTPTNTLVPPTATPTRTNTPTPSITPSMTPSPTGPTATPTSQFPFIIQPNSIILRENFANTAGCNWQGLAGQTTTTRGEPVIGVQVRVRGQENEYSTLTGTNTFYGPSGWEIVVGNQAVVSRYSVSLWYNNVQVSPTVEIVFPGSCQQNLATVNFVLTRPLE